MSTTHTADTSVVVPALAEWHEQHDLARSVTEEIQRLPAHVAAETYSVLTRLPHGLALAPADAADLLLTAFPGAPLTLAAEEHRDLIRRLGSAGVRGGQIYDAIVAATAAGADAELITLDERALPVYRTVGVRHRLATSRD